jgi:tRNA guanosine-2'-O-methyltransferase
MPFLIKKQTVEGYSIIGLEQSSESVMLPEFKFPKKCLLVLGREKEGLPAEIIRILDYTIEIPQLGLIRSLNVHVSGAIALYEYRRQHPPPKKR